MFNAVRKFNFVVRVDPIVVGYNKFEATYVTHTVYSMC